MNHPVIFLVFLLLTAASTIAQDDITSTLSTSGGSPAGAAPVGRIIGGNDVPFGTYPWFAKARMGNDWGGMFMTVVLLQHLFFLLCFMIIVSHRMVADAAVILIVLDCVLRPPE